MRQVPGPLPHGFHPRNDGQIGMVHSWDMSTGVDGPGTRFVLFVNGCPLRCLYCSNPDTWHMRDGRSTDVEEAMDKITACRDFLLASGGGVTVTGGEPLLQARFVEAVLTRCRELGLHTALDTSGYLGARAGDRLLSATDLVLLDIKSFDPDAYRRLTGRELAPTLVFARRLADLGIPVWLRFVLVPGLTEDAETIDELAAFAAGLGNVERVDVLPFHKLGAVKYDELGITFPLRDTPPPTAELVERVRAQFHAHGLRAH
ncbi:pyruvate formate-lyase-activating protein [Embleya sp. NPDC050493]|uniref:pyruvate formate-lyase-activating protein n=1 Tax=Embleya sp. NPDC050493 TaxID=3363989 RepID=UPI0037A1FF61